MFDLWFYDLMEMTSTIYGINQKIHWHAKRPTWHQIDLWFGADEDGE